MQDTARLWAGRILTALPALFLIVDGGMKAMKAPVVLQATAELGYPESSIFGIGVTLLLGTLLYLILGAILLTG